MFGDRDRSLYWQLLERGNLSRPCGFINSLSAIALSPLSAPTCAPRQYPCDWLVLDQRQMSLLPYARIMALSCDRGSHSLSVLVHRRLFWNIATNSSFMLLCRIHKLVIGSSLNRYRYDDFAKFSNSIRFSIRAYLSGKFGFYNFYK